MFKEQGESFKEQVDVFIEKVDVFTENKFLSRGATSPFPHFQKKNPNGNKNNPIGNNSVPNYHAAPITSRTVEFQSGARPQGPILQQEIKKI